MILKEQEIAAIADVHGNSFALTEVLKDIKRRGIETRINLGDSIYGPLDPVGTYKLLMDAEVIGIGGNECRLILENLESESENRTIEYVKSQIDGNIIEWLKILPFDLSYKNEIFCCHGTPLSDTAYLLEELNADHVAIKSSDLLDKMLSEVSEKVILCGHSHVPRIVKTNNKLIINAGSVGLPAYDDELPVYHKMETYYPFASYSILTKIHNTFLIDQVAVEYDFEQAAKLAEVNGRDDWAKWIRTGVV